MENDAIAAVILVGGFSSRMGDFKPLLPFGKTCVLAASIRPFLFAGITNVLAVTGYRADDLHEVLDDLGVLSVYNDRYREGMFSSVQAGVHALGELEKPAVPKAFFVMPGDCPCVDVETVLALSRAWHAEPGRIYSPYYGGKKGHPVLLPARLAEGILTGGKESLREVIESGQYPEQGVEVKCSGVLEDMDIPESYQRLLQNIKEPDYPSPDEVKGLLSAWQAKKKLCRHLEMVSRTAACIARKLNDSSNAGLNIDLIEAGALLHDIGKGRHNHPQAGKRLLDALAFPETGTIIGQHMDIIVSEDLIPNEAELVYLADKLVEEDVIVSIEKRFSRFRNKFLENNEILAVIDRRLQDAVLISNKVENITGMPLFEIILEIEIETEKNND